MFLNCNVILSRSVNRIAIDKSQIQGGDNLIDFTLGRAVTAEVKAGSRRVKEESLEAPAAQGAAASQAAGFDADDPKDVESLAGGS